MTVLPPVPQALAARGIALRPEVPEDDGFLSHLYVSVRWQELEPVPWPEAAKLAFLREQCRFQTLHYKKNYHNAAWGIVTAAGTPVGRLYLHQAGADLRIIDISLLPSHRRQGIGSALIRAVFAQGAAAGTGVSIHVEVFNLGAQRLYERLGFVPHADDTGVYRRMDWSSPAGRTSHRPVCVS